MSRAPKESSRPSRSKPPEKPPAARVLAFAALAAAVLGLVGWGVARALRPQQLEEGAQQVTISMAGFAPNVVRAKAGQPVAIQLINPDTTAHTDGGGWHNFVVPELGVVQKVAPESTAVFTVVAERPGAYRFYCDICCGGKDNPYMNGVLIVEPA